MKTNYKFCLITFVVILIPILLSIFSLSNMNNLYDSLLIILNNIWYILVLFLLTNCYVYSLYKDYFVNKNILQRYSSKKELFHVIIFKTIKYVISTLILTVILASLILILIFKIDISVFRYSNYPINIVTYLLLFVLKDIIMFGLTSLIFIMLLDKFGGKTWICLLFVFILLVFLYNNIYEINLITSIREIPLLILPYYGTLYFKSFNLEIFSYLVQFLILFAIYTIIYKKFITSKSEVML